MSIEQFNSFKESYTPFGPVIYRGKITDRFKEEILQVARDGETSKNKDLAGNLERQVTEPMSDLALDELTYHSHRYIDDLRSTNRFAPPLGLKKFNTINVVVHHPWVNIQKKGEWNPPHAHSLDLSCVIYAQVPEELKDEWKHPNQQGRNPCGGKIDFIYGNMMTHSCNTFGPIEPIENDIWIFPAWLTHQVYPFNADVERISCSTNFTLEYFYEEKEN